MMDANDMKLLGKRMPTEDMISRAEAIDVIFSEPLYKSGLKKRDADEVVPVIYEKIKSLPSAQPEQLGTNLAEVGTDCISRQAALDCFHDWIDKHGDVHTPDEMAEYRAIEALPSAQPELTDEDKRLIKELRSYHNGSYAKVIDKLIAPRVADAVDTRRGEGDE